MFLFNKDFDQGIIFILRCVTKNFILQNRDLDINGLPIVESTKVEAQLESLDQYIEEVLMKMGEDAFGVLLFIVPKALRLNINIVNLETNNRKKEAQDCVSVTNCNSTESIKVIFKNDKLNFHERSIFVLRKDGHYDIIYKP